MNSKDLIEKVIKELSSVLKKKYSDFRGIYFFGSRARGIYKEDYDFVFVFDRKVSRKFKDEIRKIIYSCELNNK
jgi:predicted nucleotidyltransferase